jgi:hypothetical protein
MNSEQIIKKFLSGYHLRAEKFDKKRFGNGKTPDYEVFKNDNLFCYCEVKNAKKDIWLDQKLKKSSPGEMVGGLRNDPVFNRLTSHIHKSRKQFDAVNKNQDTPNILAFYNQDQNSGFLDLLAVITGNFFSENGKTYPIYKSISEGRIKADIEKIHLFIWLDEFKPHRFLFSLESKKFQNELCKAFKFDPRKLEIVHS